MLVALLSFAAAAVPWLRAVRAAPAAPSGSHALSMYGDIKYGPGFKHFDYVNSAAPKGGDVRLAAIGTFDNLNPFILKGIGAAGIGQTFDTLAVNSAD